MPPAARAQTAFSALFLGLGGVALLVGGIGVANTMCISGLGGLASCVIGVTATVLYMADQHWPPVISPQALIGAFLGAILVGMVGIVGMVAGKYPSVCASLLTPTRALAST